MDRRRVAAGLGAAAVLAPTVLAGPATAAGRAGGAVVETTAGKAQGWGLTGGMKRLAPAVDAP